MKLVVLLMGVLGLAACASPAHQRDPTVDDLRARVVGWVVDDHGIPLDGATVVLIASEDLRREQTTDEHGTFEFHFLFPDASYDVTVHKTGYRTRRLTVVASDSREAEK